MYRHGHGHGHHHSQDPRHAKLEPLLQRYARPGVVRNQAHNVFQQYPFLDPVQNALGEAELEGTVQCMYQGTSYHYPLTVRLPFRYPDESAMCFISQRQLDNANMMLSPSNRYVRNDGIVQTTCGSPLMPVLTQVVQLFQGTPPVYAKPAQQAPPAVVRPPASNPYAQPQQPSTYTAQTQHVPVQNPYQGGGGGGGAVQKPYSGAVYPPPAAQTVPARAAVQEDDWQGELLKSLRTEVRTELESLCKDQQAETQGNVESLEMQADSAAKDVAALDAEIEQMRKKAAEIRAKEALLEAKVKEGKEWLAENEGALSKKPEDMLPTNELDAQIIELTAESNALDDMLHLVGRCGENAETIVKLSMDLGRRRFEAVCKLNKAMKKKADL